MVTARDFINKPMHKNLITWCKIWHHFISPNFWIANHFIDRTVNIHHIPDHCTIFKNLKLTKQTHTKEHQKRLDCVKFNLNLKATGFSTKKLTKLASDCMSRATLGWPTAMKFNTDMELVSTLYLYFLSDTSNRKVVKITIKFNAMKSKKKQNNIKRETKVWYKPYFNQYINIFFQRLHENISSFCLTWQHFIYIHTTLF